MNDSCSLTEKQLEASIKYFRTVKQFLNFD